MDRNARSKLNTQIYEEACEWFVECRSGEPGDAARREFDRWLRKSPEHLSAYLEIAAIWNEGPSLDAEHAWDVETLVAQATECDENVVSLTGPAAVDFPPRQPGEFVQRGTRARKWPLLAYAASIAVVGLITLTWLQVFHVPTYSTAVGEQRSIALADGSTIELNSRSRIKVRYSEQERNVELLNGQALFNVAKDSARPFVVTSDETRVRAVGTQFDVYRKRGGTVVTVLEGRVAVLTNREIADPDASSVDNDPSVTPSRSDGLSTTASRKGPGAGIFLSAGEQITVTPMAVQKTAHPNVAGATAWTQRQIVFESASISEVAEEFNRYNERKLIVRDAELYDFHISGVFSSTDPASLIRFLRTRPGIQVIETASEIRVEKKVR